MRLCLRISAQSATTTMMRRRRRRRWWWHRAHFCIHICMHVVHTYTLQSDDLVQNARQRTMQPSDKRACASARRACAQRRLCGHFTIRGVHYRAHTRGPPSHHQIIAGALWRVARGGRGVVGDKLLRTPTRENEEEGATEKQSTQSA